MTTAHVVELKFKKEPNRRLTLDYVETPMNKTQPRFQGRSSLEPVIDFSAYECKAVIDWVDIELSLGRRTQFRYLQDLVGRVLPRVQHVKPLEKTPSGTTSRFCIRIQQPSLAKVEEAIASAQLEYGFSAEPGVSGLEVSIDFTPKDFSDDARARMVGVLMWHLFPDWDYMSRLEDRPRFTWGRNGKTRHLIKANNRKVNQSDYVKHNVGDRPAAVDATLYVGEDEGPLMWRVQNKVTDQRNVAASTIVELAKKDRRARVEVTMRHEELGKVGITRFADLRSFSFRRLQGRYFRFMLPTFKTEFEAKEAAVGSLSETYRMTKFKNTGVIGLIAMDEELDRSRHEQRPEVIGRLRKTGKKVLPPKRLGKGSSGTLLAYEVLGRRIETALRGLTSRERSHGA